MTQLNAAERLGITPQAVSKWERGESMPDITLLPEIAEMYGTSVEEILASGITTPGGETAASLDSTEAMQVLNSFVNEKVFSRVRQEFERVESVGQLSVPVDFFMALNTEQKDVLLGLLMDMEDFATIADDITPYLNISQRTRLIRNVAERGDFETLETLIPFMTKQLRTEIVLLLLERNQPDFLDDLIMFLNYDQRELIIHHFIDNQPDFELLERFMPFFSATQRKLIAEWMECQ